MCALRHTMCIVLCYALGRGAMGLFEDTAWKFYFFRYIIEMAVPYREMPWEPDGRKIWIIFFKLFYLLGLAWA